MPSDDPNLLSLEILDANLTELLVRDSMRNIIRSYYEGDEYKQKQIDEANIDDSYLELSADSDKLLMLTVLLGSVVLEALDLVVSLKINSEVDLGEIGKSLEHGRETGTGTATATDILITHKKSRRSIEDVLRQCGYFWVDERLVTLDTSSCQINGKTIVDDVGTTDNSDTSILSATLATDTSVATIATTAATAATTTARVLDEEVHVDLDNWYCECHSFQSKINDDLIVMAREDPRFESFTIANKSNKVWQILCRLHCNQYLPLPICSHLLCLLIIIYNYQVYKESL